MTANQIRQAFLDFFRSKEHMIVPSAPMVVKNDPTLMFTNAGMNQFKDIFLGNEPAKYPRVADTQKCLRVSGKHNDLEEVGHDTYHHTMFEMLGNWSFGDYFKKEAIDWAWEFLVDVCGLDRDRIYATVFEGSPEENVPFDQEAWEEWAKFLPASHILKGNKKDNFWEMGDTGPCGPCSEIHFDLRDEAERAKVDGASLVNQSDPQVIEIWNLVFMQFNRKATGLLEPLPAKSVDTGMGFERLCMVIQGVKSNYDTDVFQPLLKKIAELSSHPLTGSTAQPQLVAMRVIADHLRTICFSIADGQLPSNVKAGYVIRRILRRAVRYGYTYLGLREPFMVRLVPTLIEQMGEQFAELRANRELMEKVIYEEENSFLKTLETGISLLDKIMVSAKVISGKDAFVLYDTFGFPIDLTELIARENGVTVDLEEFTKELEIQKNRSRNAAAVENDDWVELMPITRSEFIGYDCTECEVKIARYRRTKTKTKTQYQLVFDQTPFYGNSGGQVGDVGFIESVNERIEIVDTLKENNLTVHITDSLPENPQASFRAVVDREKRAASAANHTATHLLHKAMRDILGTHVEQKGSLVTPEYLRFDFSHFQKVTPQEIREIERAVNRAIRANALCDENRACTMEQAQEIGAMMLFGEKYGEAVRVIRFGDSVELCGGIHCTATGDIGLFKITSEGSSSAGVRRIEAITAAAAEQSVYNYEDAIAEINMITGSPKTVEAVRRAVTERSELEKELEALRQSRDNEIVKKLREAGAEIIVERLDLPVESVKYIAFELKKSAKAVVIGSNYGGKPTLSVGLSDDAVKGGLSAGNIVREAAKLMQGGGGGQAHFATAGGKNPDGLSAAVAAAESIVRN
ncbi:Alanyl-tRNA synthetase [Mucinivorans hirudinis]|uniref:Alanine--tRNA ligase n=1 Tax=Mucinivorans hirudinis TaxID=1433126 RepID=A0A060R8W2_9BACT|nr:Alanyl-tRNA synthetase [Mucinivorans hirudinis]